MMVVLAGMGFYIAASETRILGEALSVKESMQLNQNQISELLEFIDMFQESSPTYGETVRVFVYNYGLKNITVSNVIVDGSLSEQNSFRILDLDGKNFTSNGENQTRVLPMSTTSELILNFSDTFFDTSQIESIVIHTDSEKLFEILNTTK